MGALMLVQMVRRSSRLLHADVSDTAPRAIGTTAIVSGTVCNTHVRNAKSAKKSKRKRSEPSASNSAADLSSLSSSVEQMRQHERDAVAAGATMVAGVDEAG